MSTRKHMPRRQRGATLIIALIMIVLITLVVINAFTLSSSNLKSVGNMQSRSESIAAANQAIETVVSNPFYQATGTQTFTVDINKDGTDDYSVVVAAPKCTRAERATPAYPSDVELGTKMTAASDWNTDWDINASVSDSVSGSKVRIVEGVRVLMNQVDKELYCNSPS